MITQTALKSPRFLAAIKTATVRAIRTAYSRVVPASAIWVYNRHGESSMYVQAARGRSPEYRDPDGRDITVMVLGALREWHQTLRQQRSAGQPIRLDDFPDGIPEPTPGVRGLKDVAIFWGDAQYSTPGPRFNRGID